MTPEERRLLTTTAETVISMLRRMMRPGDGIEGEAIRASVMVINQLLLEVYEMIERAREEPEGGPNGNEGKH